MKIGRNDIIEIAKSRYKLLKERPEGNLSYEKWVQFIENHKDYFVWFEDTYEGKEALLNIKKMPDWARQAVLYSLNKTTAHGTNVIVKNSSDLIVKYSSSDGLLNISLENKMSKEIADVLLKMANYLDALLLNNGTEIIDEKVIESLT